jgi:hypothetical protein
MRRFQVTLTAFAAVAVVAGVVATSAPAANPHFVNHFTSVSLRGSDLACKFKEAGLGAGSTETIVCEATATTTYECVNRGGHHPQAENKTTTVTQVSDSGQFTADKNGNVNGSLTLSPPTASDLGFTCPDHMRTVLVSVSYSNVSIRDVTSGAVANVGGTFTYTNPNAP